MEEDTSELDRLKEVTGSDDETARRYLEVGPRS
jgi:hypothetical protein